MKLTIVREDSVVIIDGVGKKVDLSTLDPSIHAIQWEKDKGVIEYVDPKVKNAKIDTIQPYSEYIEAWNSIVDSPKFDNELFEGKIKTLEDSIAPVNKLVLKEAIDYPYPNLEIKAYKRPSDNRYIGIYCESAKGVETGTGTTALLSLRKSVFAARDLGVHWFARLEPTDGGITLEEFTNFFITLGCNVIYGNKTTFVWLPVDPAKQIVYDFKNIKRKLQDIIDAKAIELGYSRGDSVLLYAGFPNPFNAEALEFADWEVSIWVEANKLKLDIEAGKNPIPTDSEIAALVPEYKTKLK